MDAETYLRQLSNINASISQDIDRLATLKNAATSSRAIDYSGARVQSTMKDILCDAVTEIVSLDEAINQKIDKYVAAKEHIIDQIRGLHNAIYNSILFNVYVLELPLKATATEMGRSYNFIRVQHQAALAAFEATYANLDYLV